GVEGPGKRRPHYRRLAGLGMEHTRLVSHPCEGACKSQGSHQENGNRAYNTGIHRVSTPPLAVPRRAVGKRPPRRSELPPCDHYNALPGPLQRVDMGILMKGL